MANSQSRRCAGKATLNPIKAGDRFGRLVALTDGHLVQLKSQRERVIPVRCDCGNEKTIRALSLKTGATVSCGCYRLEVAAKAIGERSVKHGHSRQGNRRPEYGVWLTMRNRCSNPKVEKYPLYGGRGIKVCNRWLGEDGYANFIADMGPRPKGCSIERDDPNGDYEPQNCRWASPKEQANNTRRNHVIEWKGESLTVAQWSERIGIAGTTILFRLKKGWTVEEALTRPLRKVKSGVRRAV